MSAPGPHPPEARALPARPAAPPEGPAPERPAPEGPAPEGPAPPRREVLREVALVFVLSLAGCLAFIGLGQVVPFVRQNLHAFVALVFLLLPSWALGRRGEGLEDRGLNGQGLGRALLVAALFALVTFPPYLLGHHVYQTEVFRRPLSFSWSNYSAFPEECQGAPGTRGPSLGAKDAAPAALSLWCDRDALQLRWRGELTLAVRGPVSPGPLPSGVHSTPSEGGLTLRGVDGSAFLRVPPGASVQLAAHRAGVALEPRAIEVGPRGQRAGESPVEAGRGLWWLLELLLAQLIAVALPEEVFYRGYLQGRLAQAFPRRRRILGAQVSVPAVFWTSVLFALGHFLLDLNPQRLAVFFPSLLFGWLRSFTPTLAGSIAYHALCNVLVRALIVHY